MDDELNKEIKLLGFPIEHKHKLCCLRQELIDSFVDSRYMMYIKYAAYHLQHLNSADKKKIEDKVASEVTPVSKKEEPESADENDNKKDSQIEANEAKKIVESITDCNKIDSNTKQKNWFRKQRFLPTFLSFILISGREHEEDHEDRLFSRGFSERNGV